MPVVFGPPVSAVEWTAVCLFVVLVILAAVMGWRAWRASRIPPEELERRRRKILTANGKMGDASLIDYREGHLFYSYDVRGVRYTASQDVTLFQVQLPADPGVLSGPVAVRYDPKNPANSIVISEDWSGLFSVLR